jgi:hypothetical protein
MAVAAPKAQLTDEPLVRRVPSTQRPNEECIYDHIVALLTQVARNVVIFYPLIIPCSFKCGIPILKRRSHIDNRGGLLRGRAEDRR